MSKEKFEQYEATKDSIRSLIGYVENESKTLKKHAPQELIDKAQEFHEFLKTYDVEKLRPEVEILTGEFFDLENMKQRIQDHTGYIWKVREIEGNELEDRAPAFEYHYNLKVDNFKAYEFYRNSNNRSELWMLELFLLPGCAVIDYSTGRVDGRTEFCKTPDELMKSFARHCG